MIGPVQVLVLAFKEAHLAEQALTEAHRLETLGIARVVDALVLSRTAAGQLEQVEVDGWAMGDVARQLLSEGDVERRDDDATDHWSLADAVPTDGVAVVMLIEHLWAQDLVDAIGRGGGRPLEECWLGPGDRALLDAAIAARG